MIPAAYAAALAGAAMACGYAVNRWLLGWLPDDPPGPGRKQHARPMPLGGLLLLPALLPWLLAERALAPAAAIALAAAVGHADDRRKAGGGGLGWRTKAMGLAGAAALGASAVAAPLDDPWCFAAAAVLVFALANATNFLDNTDGVAAAVAAVSLLALGHGGGWPLAAGCAALGFLPWNWPRPVLFLGDSGAYVLGTATGIAAAAAAAAAPAALWTVAVQLADFLQVVAARLALGVPPWIGDRRHLTHIAMHLGVPRIAIAPLCAALAIGLASLARPR